MKKTCLILAILLTAGLGLHAAQMPGAKAELRGVWFQPGDAGHNEAEIAAWLDKVRDAGINTLVMDIKNGSRLYFPSNLFPEAVDANYREFDVLGVLIREAHKRSMKVHAWLTDFLENEDGFAYRHHPEWAELNPDGKTTASETLGATRPYTFVWMCPARRPGYTDQYLLPLIREIVTRYDVDGIHHDYVRYPGDVNPDGYCFCDYCLEDIFRHHHLVYETEPNEPPVERVLPRMDADLGREYTPKPPQWDHWTRREKANFLLYGRYGYESAPDMSYFFYTYRTDAIKEFVRATYELVKSIRPGVVVSAAVFKNPQTSGRFIGQRWTDWTEYVDEMMPMTYRSHFSVGWEAFLKEFAEYTRYQKKWVGQSEFDQGIATVYLYREMSDPVRQMNAALDRWVRREGEGGADRAEVLRVAATTESQLPAGARKDEFREALQGLPQAIHSEAERQKVRALRTINDRLLGDPPPGFFPPERLVETIRVARANGADGIVLFSGGLINNEHLWGAVKEAFSSEKSAGQNPPSSKASPR